MRLREMFASLLRSGLLVSSVLLLGACGSNDATNIGGPSAARASISQESPAPLESSPQPFSPISTPTLEAWIQPSATTLPSLLPSRTYVANSGQVLADGLGSPDDLALGPDGSIYFSDIADGTINRLAPDGQIVFVVSGLQEPEGLAFLPDGTLLIAEQGKDRVMRYDLSTRLMSPFLVLENRNHRPGIDGIVFDRGTGTLIIPDSPNGTVLRVGQSGRVEKILARGLVRPTGAAVEASGSVLVADENSGAIRRVPAAGGTAQLVVRVSVPDDVIVDSAGNIYVNSLSEGTIHRISARSSRDIVIVRGLTNPQGIVLDAAGDLVIAESGRHRLVRIVRPANG